MFIKQQCKQTEKTQSPGSSAQKTTIKNLTTRFDHLLIKLVFVLNHTNFH